MLIVYTGQCGSRLLRKGRETDRIDPREDDRYWKLGCIYFNPDDPSLMVEKRFGVGWTMNMARPAAWMILAGILLAVAVDVIVKKDNGALQPVKIRGTIELLPIRLGKGKAV